MDDESAKELSARWLYVAGSPGCGKSAVLFEAAVRTATSGMNVLIVCPTGQLVHSYKQQLPDVADGGISVDTIHGVLRYKRKGADSQVSWTPPTLLRRIDLILVDEASQYDDREWDRFYQSVREQPHLPYVVVVADFAQLQPLGGGGSCWYRCQDLPTDVLNVMYHSSDTEHLQFLERIRVAQPSRPLLKQYFGERHWQTYSLSACVEYGMELGKAG